MKGKSLQQQDLQSRTENKPTKGSKRSEDSNNQADLKEVKKKRSKSQDPPKATNSSDMKSKKGEKDDVKIRGKENAKAKDNKTNKDKNKSGKDNQNTTKDKVATNKGSPKKGQQTKDEKSKHQFKQEKDNHKQDKSRGAYSKDDIEIERKKKQKRNEENERVHKSIQTDKSALKSKDDHSVQYDGKNDGRYGYSSNGESGGYGHRKSDANSESERFRDSTGYNSSDGDGSLSRGFRHHFSSQKYYASVSEKTAPPPKPSSKPKARFGPIDSEDNLRTSQSRGKPYVFEELDEDRYEGPEYIRSRFSAKSGTRNHTTLSMYSVKSSRVLDDEEDLERCSSNLSDRGTEHGIDRPTDELIDLEDSLNNRPRHNIQNGDVVENGESNGDRIINEYDVNNFENSGSHQVNILKITTPGDSPGKDEDNGEISNGRNSNEAEKTDQTEDVLERRLQALKSNGSPLLRTKSPQGNVKERRRSERFPDNTNLLASDNDNEKTKEEHRRTEDEGSPQQSAGAKRSEGSPQMSARAQRSGGSPQMSAGAKRSGGSPQMSAVAQRSGGSPQMSAVAQRSGGSPQMSARAQRSGGSPERNPNERRRSDKFPDTEHMLEKKNERETKASTSVKKSTSIKRSQRFPSNNETLPSTEKSSFEQRKLKQTNSFRGRSRNPVRRFRVSKNPQEINASTGDKGNPRRTLQKGPQSLDRNVPSRKGKDDSTENKNPITESFPPRPPSRPRSHDGRYSVDSLYLPDDYKKPEVDNSQQQPNDRDDDIREDSLERPHLIPRDSLYTVRQDNNIEQKGNDKDGKESEEENNQYAYSGYGYNTSQDR